VGPTPCNITPASGDVWFVRAVNTSLCATNASSNEKAGSSSNLALMLGLGVGLGLVVLYAIAFVLCWFLARQNNPKSLGSNGQQGTGGGQNGTNEGAPHDKKDGKNQKQARKGENAAAMDPHPMTVPELGGAGPSLPSGGGPATVDSGAGLSTRARPG
jgi:hypothetical protein